MKKQRIKPKFTMAQILDFKNFNRNRNSKDMLHVRPIIGVGLKFTFINKEVEP